MGGYDLEVRYVDAVRFGALCGIRGDILYVQRRILCFFGDSEENIGAHTYARSRNRGADGRNRARRNGRGGRGEARGRKIIWSF